uniref:NOL9 C-terminal domain-containing protein n=1 Tax=Ciona savignyi TaxID=51511 RepID=H2YPZ6_CIOSA
MEIGTNTPEIIKYMAPDYRNLSMLSKLLEIADACFSRDNKTTVNMCRKSLLGKLQKAKPYKIALKQLQLYNATDSPVKYKHAFAALNASVVALCKTEQPDLQNLQADDIIPPPHPCQCVGVGLVRGIDHDSGVIYVLSDLSLDQLLTVDCIIRGNSAVPEPLMLEQGKMDSSGGSLYVTKNFPYETVGAGMFKVHRKFSKLTRDGK